ncbi:MAG: GNAT family N-acetyltransferase [Clostridia bacterium]|nr:GNAT family N-acetyltransferase [Clostridia bacterium]
MKDKFIDVTFEKLEKDDRSGVAEMSALATSIIRDYYDPILGSAQNDYMLEMFQSERSILEQLDHGANYYFIRCEGRTVGFLAFYLKKDHLYLSKFYIEAVSRGRGAGTETLRFLKGEANKAGVSSIRLNVNKNNLASIGYYEAAGFIRIRSEINDIGGGFFMDDHVYSLDIAND